MTGLAWALIIVFAGICWIALRAVLPSKSSANRSTPDMLDDQPAYRPATFKAAEQMKYLYPVTAQLALHYRGADAEPTRRVITMQEYSADPPGYLFAFCHLRNEVRTFRVDRIAQATAIDTGEIIKDVPAYLMAAYERSPIAGWARLLSEHILALRALVYLAKADGTFSTKERDLLVEHCQQLLHRDDLTRPDMNKALRALPATTPVAFRQVIGQLAHYPAEYRARVIATANAMVGTQRTIAPAEQEALDLLVSRLSPPN